ncbi:MAG TPA: hypothetical protein VFE25_00060 [Opitutaceae bacterium]|nr:hypothetical protein [Opitutaceae bacterium]
MDKPLINQRRHPAAWWIASACAAALLVAAEAALRAALLPVALWTGTLLYALVLALALFNARKKLPFLPLTRASTWLRFHVYGGWLAVLLFFLHAGTAWPDGRLNQILAAVFLLVAASGALGLFLSRWVPSKLTASGEALTYERIPEIRRQIRTSVEALIVAADHESDSSTLGDFYVNHLLVYVNWRPGLFALPFGDPPLHRKTISSLVSLNRYFNAREREIASELREWIEAKRNLDTQLVGQRLLKLWLFVHIPLSCSLIILGLVHGLVAVHFTRGL